MKPQKLALIGCGLMGGSFALAARRAGWASHIHGFSASETTRHKALALGVIDQAHESIEKTVEGADLVLLAVPLSATAQCFEAIAQAMPSSALLMDVGSTKSDVVAVAQTTLAGKLSCFVPAHPIAGKEVAGIEHADADLYQNRQVILTPTASSGVLQVALAQEIWRSLGGHVFQMTPAQHDATFAAVSHVPHLLAYALINAIAAQADGAQLLAMGGPGFRDFSRIAASDPVIWRDILMANRHEVLRQTALLRQALEDFETALQQGQPKVLQQLIAKASATRAAWRLSGSSDSDV